MERLTFVSEEGESLDFFVLEQTRVAGKDYLLVTESEAGDGDAFILRDESPDGAEEAAYVFVEDADECEALRKIFSEMLEDIDLS